MYQYKLVMFLVESIHNASHTLIAKIATESDSPSINPFSSAYWVLGPGGSRVSRVSQKSLFPATFSSSSWGILRLPQARHDILYNQSIKLGIYCGRRIKGRRDPDQVSEPSRLTHLYESVSIFSKICI